MAVIHNLSVSEMSGSQNITTNSSLVRIVWQSQQTGDSRNDYTRIAYYYISINGGPETEYTISYTLPRNTTKTILDITIAVPHNDDGSGTVNVRTWMDTGISAGVKTQSQSIGLATIPRATAIDSLSCSTKYFTGDLTYKYTTKSSGFYNQCNIYHLIGDDYVLVRQANLGQKEVAQQTETVIFTNEELEEIYNKLPNSNNGKLRVAFKTYSDSAYSSQIGNEQNIDITLYIPDDAETKPSAKMILSPVSPLPAPFGSLYIKGRSKVDAIFTDFEGKYNAEFKSGKICVEGKVYGSPYTSVYLNTTGSVTVTGTVEDTRGFISEYMENINVLHYAAPNILPASGLNEVVCSRCDEDGNLADNGIFLKIKAMRSYSKLVSDGVQNNFCQIRYRYKSEFAEKFSEWVTLPESDYISADTVDTQPIAGVVSSAETAYVVQVGVIDDIGEDHTIQFSIPSDFVTIDIPEILKGKRMGLLRYARNSDEPGVDVGAPIYGGCIDSLKLGMELVASEEFPISLNDQKTPGMYYSQRGEFITDTPNEGGFVLEVRELQIFGHIQQTLYYDITHWVRHWDGVEWSEWARFVTTTPTETPVADIVVEQGTSGIWTYRKWKSGEAECWGKQTGIVSCVEPWGSLFFGSIPEVNFPEKLFTTVPVLITSIENQNFFLVKYGATEQNTGIVFPVSAVSIANQKYALLHIAKGRWK